jgi:hypothetical protein
VGGFTDAGRGKQFLTFFRHLFIDAGQYPHQLVSTSTTIRLTSWNLRR